jgi:cation transport ATPase
MESFLAFLNQWIHLIASFFETYPFAAALTTVLLGAITFYVAHKKIYKKYESRMDTLPKIAILVFCAIILSLLSELMLGPSVEAVR